MQSTKTKTKHFSFLLLITLGVMTAFGPLTIDMYVPSLPKVQGDFRFTYIRNSINIIIHNDWSCTRPIYLLDLYPMLLVANGLLYPF